MNLAVTKNDDGTVLTVAIEGSIDTVTAPRFEAELNPLYDGVRELILDFAAVDYVSSAGLRVIMSADQPSASSETGSLCHFEGVAAFHCRRDGSARQKPKTTADRRG